MRRIVTAGVAGIALAGIVGIGVASAATGKGPTTWVSDTLAGLVDDGTINQDQADAVGKALAEANATQRAEHDAQREAGQAQVDTLLQDTLGKSLAEVRDALRSGTTLHELAGDKADELVAGAGALLDTRLATEVSTGRLTQEQADTIAAEAKARAQAWLAGQDTGARGLGFLLGGAIGAGMPGGAVHGPGMGGPGMHGSGMDGPGMGGPESDRPAEQGLGSA